MAGQLTFVAITWFGLTLINRFLEGAFFTTAEVNLINTMGPFTTFRIFNLMSVPVPNISFWTSGVSVISNWDYSFFTGGYFIFQAILFAITIGVTANIFIYAINVGQSFLGRK